jgi:hypothetical protein
VSVAYEAGKWKFDMNGEIQSFEDSAKYQKRHVTDRFTPEMLKKYCYALGIRVDSPDFYQSPTVLVSTDDPLPAGHLTLSLAQAQQKMGFVIGDVKA